MHWSLGTRPLKNGMARSAPTGRCWGPCTKPRAGGGWTNADGWLGDGPLGEWYGVDVDSSGLVSTVDLAGNGLSGGLPGRLGDLAGLTTLRVGDNALTGRLPTSLRLTPLQELRYANTSLCAPVELWFQDWLAALAQHEGTGVQCPPLSAREILTVLYETTDGPNWEESGNWLTDAPLGEWHGVEVDADGTVVSLDLRWNGLDGAIPPELGGLAELETLILFRNRLTGPIPSALGALATAKLVVLTANELSGPIPPELGGLASVEELFLNENRLTSVPAELGDLSNLRELSLNFNRLTSVPAKLGGLAKLESLGLWSNELTSIPAELSALASLRRLVLKGNRLTSIPPELGRLDRLEVLWLASNELTSIPAELSALESLWRLVLEGNRLTAVPPGPGGFASLAILDLSSNEFTSFPHELGGLGNLRQLELDGNRLTDIPPGVGGMGGIAGRDRLAHYADELPPTPVRLNESRDPWRLDPERNQWTSISRKLGTADALRTHLEFDRSRSTNVGSRVGGFASLQVLDLSSNEFSGSLPAGLVEFTGLTSLGLSDNAGLTGALPLDMTALERLEDLHTTGTELCAPADPSFLDWLEGVTRQRVALCDRDGDAAAYLTQVVQSREFPVPLVAGEPALLRVFVTAGQATDVALPPVRATFYRDGAVIHEVDIPGKADPIPTAIDEGSLSRSVNAELPGWVIQPGLEFVIEPDPEGMLDPELGVARRIPATGRMAVDVHAMPVFELTLVPFIWEESPDSSIVEITAAMAADPEGHELFERAHLLLPIAELVDTRPTSPMTTAPSEPGDTGSSTATIRASASCLILRSTPTRWEKITVPTGTRISRGAVTTTSPRLSTIGWILRRPRPATPQETLLLWGGVHKGDLRLEPAFAHDARVKLPEAPGPYQLEGRDAEGHRLFSFSFTPDALDHGGSGFLFAIPLEPAWTEDLDRITLTGPEGSTTLDRETGGRAAMVIDRASGRVRTIARDWSVGNAAFAAAMASDAQVEIIRGLPRK